ncbi:hypothetical protein KS4_34350 [Poriferisphaera corsica]|uniref:DUF501 domain-containing protein n=1 Tax=Poriferisphaera corsica TaxID=2528020 RepID=A0A517YYP1_9BACT|nr:DUF501 domain-containing protein [Poriferisphaera corsica]QDU35354.1 hypothetical protein KS4_34350 [Poriferisphaera corsica]
MLSDQDTNMLKQQLGRIPRGVLAVIVRSSEDAPVVIVNYPLHHCCEGRDSGEGKGGGIQGEGGERLVPFPTLYWLTNPRLNNTLADMERLGVIDDIQNQINANHQLEHQVANDHRAYIEQRWKQLTKGDQEKIQKSPAMLETLRTRGIGGISNFLTVKCLHLHYAHHLATLCMNPNDPSPGTAVGRLIEQANPELLKIRQSFKFGNN